jgi:hypothetical protein
MFERLKFIIGFASAYRRARKSGLAHADAQLAAVRELTDGALPALDRSLPGNADIPEAIAGMWRDPETAFAGCLPDGSLFDVTPRHIDLMRHMRFAWEGAERGAPMLDPQQPYGRRDLIAQLRETFGSHDDQDAAKRHVEMFFVLARCLRHGHLLPGRYAFRNIDAGDVCDVMRGYGGDRGLSDADLGLDADGLVTLTNEHLKLLRQIEIRWPSEWECEERLDMGAYPAATADCKRPYGDHTFIEVDMARILGRLPRPQEDEENLFFEPSEELQTHLQRLHWQMLVAMQVLVEHAELKPGSYALAGSA